MNRGHRTNNGYRRKGVLALLVLALAMFGLAACGSDDDDNGGTASGGNGDGNAAADRGTISIGWIPWDEDIAVTHLWQILLEEQGYEVDTTQVDAAPLFQGLADGELDVFLDAWLPTTHEDYWAEHEDDLLDMGVWNAGATLHLTVPDYVDAETIEDLVGRADDFDGQIVGIEPGAGLMRLTKEAVIPDYGLDDYTVLDSSTPAMITELQAAIEAEENIVVTLWRPHWAYAALPLKDLTDTKGSFGEGDEIHALANAEWAEANEDAVRWFGNFDLTDDQLADLANLVINEHDGEIEGARAWLEDPDNRAIADSWID